MNKIPLKADDREILGRKVSSLRRNGFIPAHVYGKNVESEHITIKGIDFKKVYHQAGETGLIELKIGETKIRPVLIRNIQRHALSDEPLHVDFFQVNLTEKTRVPVPVVMIGEEPELVHAGEAVVIQPINEVEVEALPADLPEKIEVDISTLKAIGDAILVSQLPKPEDGEILADPEAVVVKLDTAITEEMQKLMEEQAAEAAAAAEAAQAEGGEAPTEGEAKEGEEGAEVPTDEESKEEKSESSEE